MSNINQWVTGEIKKEKIFLVVSENITKICVIQQTQFSEREM